MKEVINQALCRATGKEAAIIRRVVALREQTAASKPGGRRARSRRAATVQGCDAALRQFVFGGVCAAHCVKQFELDLSQVKEESPDEVASTTEGEE